MVRNKPHPEPSETGLAPQRPLELQRIERLRRFFDRLHYVFLMVLRSPAHFPSFFARMSQTLPNTQKQSTKPARRLKTDWRLQNAIL